MNKTRRLRWLFDLARKRDGAAWKCTYCQVIGSHRRGCHYVTEAHHRPAKSVRHGILGTRARAARAGRAK